MAGRSIVDSTDAEVDHQITARLKGEVVMKVLSLYLDGKVVQLEGSKCVVESVQSFAEDVVLRTVAEAKRQVDDTVDAPHLQKILPQLMFDHS